MTGQELVTVSNGSALPHLESVDRISKLPLVESALGVASGIYGRVKESSYVANWTFTHAEGVGVAILAPVASRLGTPIHAVDNIIAKGMDMVEEAVPAIKMTPKEVIDNTREMLASAFGLKHPESVASIPARIAGASMGATIYGLRATVTVLEDYMDKYHPATNEAETSSKPEERNNCGSCKNEPAHIIHRWKVVLTRISDVLTIMIKRRKEEAATFLTSILQYGYKMAPPPRPLGTIPASILAKQDNLTSTKQQSVSLEKTSAADKASDSALSTPVTPKEKDA